MNLFDVGVAEGVGRLGGLELRLPARVADERATVGVRPEHVRLVEGTGYAVEIVEFLGTDAYVYGDLAGAGRLVVRVDPREAPAEGSILGVELDADRLHVFAAGTGDRLA